VAAKEAAAEKYPMRGDSHGYAIWIGDGQAILGQFNPKGTCTDVHLVRLKIEPPSYPSNEIDIYFQKEADLVETAKTFRRIAEGIERLLWPVLEPDWANIPGGEA